MGLSFDEMKELLEYIKKNHSWENMYEICNNYPDRKIVKYVSFNVDTRTNDVWQVSFYNLINCEEYKEINFRTELDYDLKDKIYNWLGQKKA